MSNMKKKDCDSGSVSVSDNVKQKERHIVSWSKEDDDVLREQIGIHGTNNWAIIASNLSYLFYRGWTPEEDTLLCEAQKKFGNRWTEIAKVVSGRTDNAVKNRFSVLCKKRAKQEASNKENNAADVNANKRKNTNGILETTMHPMKTRRRHIAATTEDCKLEQGLVGESSSTRDEESRPPFAILVQNCNNTNTKAPLDASRSNMVEGDLLNKNDPKMVEHLPSETINPTSFVDAATNQDILPSCNEHNNDAGSVCPLPNSEFNSPLLLTPFFTSMARGIPSPQFSESEKGFLLKTLGMELTPPNTTTGISQSPPCKRALLHCL
nr:transcription factor MYB124-like isoform X1 [Tanacetum cinerariifolium]